MLPSPSRHQNTTKSSKNSTMGLRFCLEVLEAEKDALNLEFKGLNMEESLKDHGLGLQLLSRRGLPLAMS